MVSRIVYRNANYRLTESMREGLQPCRNCRVEAPEFIEFPYGSLMYFALMCTKCNQMTIPCNSVEETVSRWNDGDLYSNEIIEQDIGRLNR